MKMRATEYIKQVQSGEIDLVSYTHEVLRKCHEINDTYHYFTQILDSEAVRQAEEVQQNPKGRLAGLFVTVKDCICVKDVATQSSSRILQGYRPQFDATVVERLRAEGAIIIAKTVQDEFGFGSFCTNTGLGFEVPLNPIDTEYPTGGSSGGSGGIARLADFPHVSLGESTGGSIVNPASLCGVYGLCPTYGRVSRNGLLDYANSLDKIGPLGTDLEAMGLVQEVISGHDPNDSTSLDEPVPAYASSPDTPFQGKVGVLQEGLGEGISPEVKHVFEQFVEGLRNQGIEVEEVSAPLAYNYGTSAYYIIAQSESSTNLARYCGLRYGAAEDLSGGFDDYFSIVRANHFGKEVKRRIIIGTFARMVGYRDAYYMKAMKVRTKIINEYKDLFSRYDILLSPTVPFVPPRREDIKHMGLLELYMADVLTAAPNLAGLPHFNMTAGFSGSLPVGITAIASHCSEDVLLQFGGSVQQ